MTATTDPKPETQPQRKWPRLRQSLAWAWQHNPGAGGWQDGNPVVALVQAGVSVTLAPVPLGVHITLRTGDRPGAVLRRVSELELANPSQLAAILDHMHTELLA